MRVIVSLSRENLRCQQVISIMANEAFFVLPTAAMSENYVVFIEQPLKMDLLRIVTGKLTGKSVSDSFLWDPKLKTIFHLVLKNNGKVRSK